MPQGRLLSIARIGYEAMPMFCSKGQEYKGSKVQGERLVEFILGGYSGKKVKNTWRIAKIFPKNTIKFLPSIFLNLNGMKVMERVRGREY